MLVVLGEFSVLRVCPHRRFAVLVEELEDQYIQSYIFIIIMVIKIFIKVKVGRCVDLPRHYISYLGE
jgi:hypothetical protein